jgi:hypothetical protein
MEKNQSKIWSKSTMQLLHPTEKIKQLPPPVSRNDFFLVFLLENLKSVRKKVETT